MTRKPESTDRQKRRAMGEATTSRRPGTWPRNLRLAFESIVTVFMYSHQAARSRAAASPSKILRIQAQLDDANWRVGVLKKELDVQRRRIASVDSACRPRVRPDDRLQLLMLAEMLGLSIKQAARRFVLHRNTLSRWFRVLRGGKDPGAFLGTPPFNKTSDSVRWLVHEMRSMGVRFGSGTGAIAAEICRAGIQLSRSSVQRILREPKPRRPRPAMVPAMGEEARHILRPEHINRTWHIDLATVDRFGRRFYVAALLDGYSRKLLALKSLAGTPTSIMMLTLVRRAIGANGTPLCNASHPILRLRSCTVRWAATLCKSPSPTLRQDGCAGTSATSLMVSMAGCYTQRRPQQGSCKSLLSHEDGIIRVDNYDPLVTTPTPSRASAVF